MTQEINDIRNGFSEAVMRAATLDALEAVRIRYLGRKGALASVFDALKNLPLEERKTVGEEANRLRRVRTPLDIV